MPDLELVIVGEGYERAASEAQVAAVGGQDWVRLPGRISDEGAPVAVPPGVAGGVGVGA